MHRARKPATERAVRHDGWTPARRRQFVEALAAGRCVRHACTGVGLSREAAYKLRRRDPMFAQEWQTALRTAREDAAEAFLASLPENLRRTMSELSARCELRTSGTPAEDTVRVVRAV
jgi:hypothetical protein